MNKDSNLIKLHLGCGPKFFPGFVHVDANDHAHVDYRVPVDDLSFLEDNSTSFIYASHLLEHFGRHDVLRVLREWNRVLAPGGTLRLAVPDYGKCAELYVSGKIKHLNDIVGLMVGGQKDQYDYHKMIFDKASLTELLLNSGFSTVSNWDWRMTEHSHVDDFSQAYLPHMDKENGTLVSLNLEATK